MSGSTPDDKQVDYQASFQAEALLDIAPELQGITEAFPDFWDHECADFFASLYSTSGLDPVTVELVMVAVLALRGWETGVRTHASMALAKGATKQQVQGAILITMSVGGVTSAARGLNWVREL